MSAHRTVARVLVAGSLWAGLALSPSSVMARHGKKPKASAKDQEQAANLLGQGQAALTAKNTAEAKTAFEEAFRKNPSPEVLFQLGKLAEAEGRLVAAQDVMRRFLQETSGDAEGPDHKEAARISQLETAVSGEVSVLGARGAWVLVDDHVVGALPLQLPLLLASGNHRIAVEFGDQRLDEQVKSLPGQTVEMRFNQKTGTVVVSVPPAVILLLDGDFTVEQQRAVTQAVAKVVARDRQVVVPADKALKLKPSLADCLRTSRCLVELGNANEALYVLRVAAKRVPSAAAQVVTPPVTGQAPSPDKAAWKFDVEVFDPAISDYAGRGSTSCDDCAIEQAVQSASTTLGTAVQQAASRARGSVEISSIPAGADVFLAGEKVGATPYKASRYVGSLPIELRLLGQPPFTTTVNVEAGQVATVDAVLRSPSDDMPEPEPTKPPPPPPRAPVYRTEVMPRPKWRLALGGVLLGGGAITAGFGISALSRNGAAAPDGPCSDGSTMICKKTFQTGRIGGVLTAVGLAAVAGGVVTIALPGPKRQVQVATSFGLDSLGLAASLTY